LVQPAEYGDKGQIFLDAGRFAQGLEEEKKAIGEEVAPINPRSDEEALAQFALAFALLQPDKAYEILHPLLLMGQSYQGFFGVTLISTSESLEQHRESTPVKETYQTPESQATASPNESQTTGTLSVTAALSQESDGLKSELATASATEGKSSAQIIGVIAKVSARNTESIAASKEDVSSTMVKVGTHVAEYEQCRAIADAARVQRQRLGGALELDRKAFEEAASKEIEAQKALKSLEEAHSSQVQEILSRATVMLSDHLDSVALTGPTGSDPQSVARWLDDADVWLIDLDAEVRAVDKKLALLRELDPKLEIPPSETVTCITFKAAFELLERRGDHLDKIIGEAQDWQRWQREFDALREQFADCAQPVQSQSLMRIRYESIYALLRRARFDDTLASLVPLFFRILGEIEGWVANEQPTAACRLLSEALSDAFHSGDLEYYYELTSYLPVPMLQDLLRSSNEFISRHVILSTLYGSIVRQHSCFFDAIWPCSGWTNRLQCVGAQLVQLFDTLQRLYLRDGNIHSVLRVLRENQTDDSRAEPNEATRKQEAETLADRLDKLTGTGHYFRLRHLASTYFFKPLIPAIRERRWRDVRLGLVQLEHRHNNGELEFEVLSKFGDTRNLRKDHQDNLNRYIDGQINPTTTLIGKSFNFKEI